MSASPPGQFAASSASNVRSDSSLPLRLLCSRSPQLADRPKVTSFILIHSANPSRRVMASGVVVSSDVSQPPPSPLSLFLPPRKSFRPTYKLPSSSLSIVLVESAYLSTGCVFWSCSMDQDFVCSFFIPCLKLYRSLILSLTPPTMIEQNYPLLY